MEYFFYCRDRPGTEAIRDRTTEEHWAFMDGYADRMIARGPTTTPDGETVTGSMHIVDLPDAEAARVFAYEEPYYKAGVFGDVLVRRWRNGLGRTMWDFDGDEVENRRFLVLGHGKPGMTARRDALLEEHRRYFDERGHLPHLIARGPLLSDEGRDWLGSAILAEFRERDAVDAMLAGEPYVRAGLYASVEVHDWHFGGR